MKIKIVHIIEDVQVPKIGDSRRAWGDVEDTKPEPTRMRLSPKVILDKTQELFAQFPNLPWVLKDNSSHHLVYIAECDSALLLDAKVERDRPVAMEECSRIHLSDVASAEAGQRLAEPRSSRLVDVPRKRRIADNPQA